MVCGDTIQAVVVLLSMCGSERSRLTQRFEPGVCSVRREETAGFLVQIPRYCLVFKDQLTCLQSGACSDKHYLLFKPYVQSF